MSFSLNCLFLGETSFEKIFQVTAADMIISDNANIRIPIDKAQVGQFKNHIWFTKKVKFSIDDPDEMNLYRVNVDDESRLIGVSTNDDIKNKLEGTFMSPQKLFKSEYFPEEHSLENVHIIISIPTSTVRHYDYNWIKSLRRPNEITRPMLVASYGAKFPLQGRDETMKILFNGHEGQEGLCERFEKRKEKDRNLHPIPVLANGPGTGKSRLLQELPTLLCDQAEKYTSDNELLKVIKNHMYAINVTFGNGTPASNEDVSIGQASVALRILYEHFISGTMKYEQFVKMCREKEKTLKISDALDIILGDVNSNKDENNHIKFVVLGIDELNALHSLYDKNLDPKLNPVHLIVRAIGGLNCSCGDVFYVSILAGTIQGPLEKMFLESTYLYLPLPLRLLREEEVWNISKFVASFERNHNLGDYINNGTFHRCISDFGGQVRALELFYAALLRRIINKEESMIYRDVMSDVKNQLKVRYPFKEFATTITPVIAHAILNIPVEEDGEVGNLTYVDLKSRGILNLESAPNHLFYVRMPYVWVWILTSYSESCEFWEVMINQKSHLWWQDFVDFNMRFWALRLWLLSTLNKNVKIQDLFCGARYLDNFEFLEYKNNKFKLPDVSSIKYQKLRHQYPKTVQEEHLSPGTVYKNGENAESWDIFFFLDDFLFAIQTKSSNATANKPQTLINKEYKKAEKAFKLLKEQVPSIKGWMLFICTNGCKTEDALDILPENCLAVYNDNFKDFYGYTFSSRAEFCAANNKLDANTAKEYELVTIDNIGPATACEIKNKRPYNDEDDLYSKVKVDEQAKKRIKVIKNIN